VNPTTSRKYRIRYSGEFGLKKFTIPLAMSATIGICEVWKYEAICCGKSRMLIAKMIGITPAWLTRSGRNV
jgi:hypothetical protein